MKITYKTPPNIPEGETIIGDMFKRTCPVMYDDNIYIASLIGAGKYSLINIKNGQAYSYRDCSDIEEIFGSFRDTFTKIQEPIELIIG